MKMKLLTFAALAVSFTTMSFTTNSANATTVNLPLNSSIYITGDIPNPTSITLVLTHIPPDPISWVGVVSLQQSDHAGGPLVSPTGCIVGESICGLFANFVDCSDGCGELLPPGYFKVSNLGEAVSINVSDSSRYLEIHWTNLRDPPPILQLTADLPDGLGITPLPAALPLFATGLGALGLLGWRRRRLGRQLVLDDGKSAR